MSPLNRGPLLGHPRMTPPVGMRAPPPRFGVSRLPMPGMPPRMSPPPPMGPMGPMGPMRQPMFGPMRQRMMPPPRAGIGMMRPGGPHPPPPPLFGSRARGVPPLMPPIMGPRGMGPRGMPVRPGPRGLMPPQGLPHMRMRFPVGNNVKAKTVTNATNKKVNKLEELELKKPWMTDEIRSEIQKKNKLYAKAKKNKDAKEWDEFKDLRNKVTRMIRDAKNDYLAKHPEQALIYKTDDQDEPYDKRDENNASSDEEDDTHYCEICDREFVNAELLDRHTKSHKTCDIDGCNYSAHPKIVELHINNTHRAGLYHRIKKFSSTPEDIEKYRAERRKEFPTKSNIARKIAIENEKMKRGEIIDSKNSKKGSKRSDKPATEKRKKIRKRKNQDCRISLNRVTEFYRGLQPFTGTADLRKHTSNDDRIFDSLVSIENATASFDRDYEISDVEEQQSVEYEKIEKLANVTSLIESCPGSLVADYGSNSDDEDEGPVEIPIKRVKLELPVEEKTPVVGISTTGKSTDQSQGDKPQNVDASPDKNSKKPVYSRDDKFKQRNHENIVNPCNTLSKKRLMLLGRLLSRSIQHERNLICQCIKHIAVNNFYQ